MDDRTRIRMSKFLSLLLRHWPEVGGIELDCGLLSHASDWMPTKRGQLHLARILPPDLGYEELDPAQTHRAT